jgi:hypothetical protein
MCASLAQWQLLLANERLACMRWTGGPCVCVCVCVRARARARARARVRQRAAAEVAVCHTSSHNDKRLRTCDGTKTPLCAPARARVRYGAVLVLAGQLSLGDLNAFLLYAIFVAGSAGGLAGTVAQVIAAVRGLRARCLLWHAGGVAPRRQPAGAVARHPHHTPLPAQNMRAAGWRRQASVPAHGPRASAAASRRRGAAPAAPGRLAGLQGRELCIPLTSWGLGAARL